MMCTCQDMALAKPMCIAMCTILCNMSTSSFDVATILNMLSRRMLFHYNNKMHSKSILITPYIVKRNVLMLERGISSSDVAAINTC